MTTLTKRQYGFPNIAVKSTSPKVLVAMFDVEIDFMGDFRTFHSFGRLCTKERSDRDDKKSEGEASKHVSYIG